MDEKYISAVAKGLGIEISSHNFLESAMSGTVSPTCVTS